jgi:hypothetical protein
LPILVCFLKHKNQYQPSISKNIIQNIIRRQASWNPKYESNKKVSE